MNAGPYMDPAYDPPDTDDCPEVCELCHRATYGQPGEHGRYICTPAPRAVAVDEVAS